MKELSILVFKCHNIGEKLSPLRLGLHILPHFCLIIKSTPIPSNILYCDILISVVINMVNGLQILSCLESPWLIYLWHNITKLLNFMFWNHILAKLMLYHPLQVKPSERNRTVIQRQTTKRPRQGVLRLHIFLLRREMFSEVTAATLSKGEWCYCKNVQIPSRAEQKILIDKKQRATKDD